jgi:hypothetical protein
MKNSSSNLTIGGDGASGEMERTGKVGEIFVDWKKYVVLKKKQYETERHKSSEKLAVVADVAV